MVITPSAIRRTIVTCSFALVAAAAPMLAAVAAPEPGTAVAQCSSGEEQDVFTTSCTPFLVPNSGSGLTTTAANPDVPEVDGIPCNGGRSSAACFGLLENEQDAGPAPVPRSTISSSP